MKKCPFCNADIQENARFCLYCMTSFEPKQTVNTPKERVKYPIYIFSILGVIVLIAVLLFIFLKPDKKPLSSTGADEKPFSSSEESLQSELNSDYDNGLNSNYSSGIATDNPIHNNHSGSTGSLPNYNQNTNNSNAVSSSNQLPENSSAISSSASSNISVNNSSNTNSSQNVNSTTPDSTPKYSYVTATFENTYPTGFSALYTVDNAIVITKVNYKESSGKYVIPAEIDGKKVTAIMPQAFSSPSVCSSVKSVTLPSTVRTIWHNAFANCNNLTDLYIKSSAIEIYKSAFPSASSRNGTITIHCKRDCRNFNFYYYRNIASDYNAVYEEWNG